ncbi:unnamed protein product [Gulo gulo]|uniref:Uncharacterized protein n=1 Tax=Gulo gulo TaxID=48420 RepID=A0A9X9LCY3_GULGU|nr:unnamed protein product [Gulo gulo]
MCLYSIFDKASVSWDINNGHIILNGLKFPQEEINSDIMFMFMFRFQFIQDPSIPKGALTCLSSLLKFFSSSFVSPTTFVDQMTSSDRLARIYMSNDDNVNMSLFLSHFGLG